MTYHDVPTDIIGALMEIVKESQGNQQTSVTMPMIRIQMLAIMMKTEVMTIVFLIIKKF